MMVLGILIAAVPFMFAAVRAVSTGSDFRYFVLAAVSTMVVVSVQMFGLAEMSERRRVLLSASLAFLATQASGAVVGGANALSVLIVSIGFVTCSTLGIALFRHARDARSP